MLESLYNKVADLFSSGFGELFKNTFVTEHLKTTASEELKCKNVRQRGKRGCSHAIFNSNILGVTK